MKESYWGYWLILLGSVIIIVMMFTQNATTTNTQDYYQLKEVANSALYESIDYSYFAQTHQVRIIKEAFVENFIKRFSQTVSLTDSYQVDFYDLYESPPKASVKLSTKTGQFLIAGGTNQLDVVNSINLIVEFNNGKAEDAITNIDPGCEYLDQGWNAN